MSEMGFIFRKLVLTGKNDLKSKIEFKRGINVVFGPTNTGKSYIIDCMDYMLGGREAPEKIEEVMGYENIFLEIESNSGAIYTLERSLSGGSFNKYDGAIDEIKNVLPEKLAQKHTKNPNNISSFLLTLAGFKETEIFVKRNKNNELQRFTYRTFNKWLLIDEIRILTKDSPIYSDNNKTKTAEESAFEFILTNIDNITLKQSLNKSSSSNGINQAKIEIIDTLISELELENSCTQLISTQDNINENIERLIRKRSGLSSEIEVLSSKRKKSWEVIQKVKSEILTNKELLKRFYLLQEQYENDKERLNFLIEGEHYFSLLNFERCPQCHQSVQTGENLECNHIASERQLSYKTELGKILNHLEDLTHTIEQMEQELLQYNTKLFECEITYQNLCDKLDLQLSPQNEFLEKEIKALLMEQNEITKFIQNENTFNKMLTEKKKLQDLIDTTIDDNDVEGTTNKSIDDSINKLCNSIKLYLKGWNFPGSAKVSFDNESNDILISNKHRRLFGKGYRSISYSAFLLGLMKYCIDKALPHPRSLILDSPITSYKEEDSPEEKTSTEIQEKFFEFLLESDSNNQIIIFENKKPSKDVIGKINFIEFTKNNKIGRYGFIENKI